MTTHREAEFSALFRVHHRTVRRYITRRAFAVLPATPEHRRGLQLSAHPGAPVLDGEDLDAAED